MQIKRYLAMGLITLLACLGLSFVTISEVAAHTPDGNATCQGYKVKATSYESKDTNTISSTFDNVTTQRTFKNSDEITGVWPQDGKAHTWSGFVHTTNSNQAYSKDYGPITLTCGTIPDDEVRYQDVVNPVNCKHHTITTLHQESHRSAVYNYETNEWGWSDWSDWVTVSKTVKHVHAPECTVYKHAHTRVHISDKCNCWRDKVTMSHGPNVRVTMTHPSRLVWRFAAVGKTVGNKVYLLPNKINGNSGWAKVQYYTVHTTNVPCPCKKTHTCHRAGPKHQHHSCKTLACKLS